METAPWYAPKAYVMIVIADALEPNKRKAISIHHRHSVRL